jgi:hypothetical protein
VVLGRLASRHGKQKQLPPRHAARKSPEHFLLG